MQRNCNKQHRIDFRKLFGIDTLVPNMKRKDVIIRKSVKDDSKKIQKIFTDGLYSLVPSPSDTMTAKLLFMIRQMKNVWMSGARTRLLAAISVILIIFVAYCFKYQLPSAIHRDHNLDNYYSGLYVFYIMIVLIFCLGIFLFLTSVMYSQIMHELKMYVENNVNSLANIHENFHFGNGGCFWVAEKLDHVAMGDESNSGLLVGTVGVVPFQSNDTNSSDDHHGRDIKKVAELKRMFVRDDYKRIGVATALLNEVEKFCIENAYDQIILFTSTMQDAACSLYRKNGFKKIKTFPHSYPYCYLPLGHYLFMKELK